MRPDTNLVIAVLGNAANAFVMRYRIGDPLFPRCGGWHCARGLPRRIWNRQRSNALSASDAWRSERRRDAGVGTHRSAAAIFRLGMRDRLWQPRTGFPKWTTGRLALSDISST